AIGCRHMLHRHLQLRQAMPQRLEAFVSLNGPARYGLQPNEERITLSRQADPVVFPARIETGAGHVSVFDTMFPLHWQVVQLA
ncbi:hypothetical protein ACCT11_35590, partial [Rhizobium johnstonii]